MEKEKLIELRERLLEEVSLHPSVSMQKRISYDVDSFNSLVCQAGFHDLELKAYPVPQKELFPYKIQQNFDYLDEIAKTVIGIYKSINFYYYKREGKVYLSPQDKKDIMREFLEYFCPAARDLYKEIYDNGKVFITNLDGNMGESYILQNIDDYYLAIDQKDLGDILELETYIHELMHIYSHHFLHNYTWNSAKNTFNGFYLETIPMYSELEFYRFLKEKGIFGDNLHFHRNVIDYNILTYFKGMHYLSEMDFRVDNEIICDNCNYKVSGNNILKEDEGVPFFEYQDWYKEGCVNEFCYGMGIIDAYDILNQNDDGKSSDRLIRKYLLSLQNPNKFDEDIMRGYDLRFMKDCLQERNAYLKKHYPVKGYRYIKQK